MQFPKHGTTEFPYYRRSMEKLRQFAGSTLPHRFRVSGSQYRSEVGTFKSSDESQDNLQKIQPIIHFQRYFKIAILGTLSITEQTHEKL